MYHATLKACLPALLLPGLLIPDLANARYVELWNPPEARQLSNPHPHHRGAGHRDRQAARRPATRPVTAGEPPPEAASGHGGGPAVAAPTIPTQKWKAPAGDVPAIPRQIGPDGRALQV